MCYFPDCSQESHSLFWRLLLQNVKRGALPNLRRGGKNARGKSVARVPNVVRTYTSLWPNSCDAPPPTLVLFSVAQHANRYSTSTTTSCQCPHDRHFSSHSHLCGYLTPSTGHNASSGCRCHRDRNVVPIDSLHNLFLRWHSRCI